jgi:hypothetical protein
MPHSQLFHEEQSSNSAFTGMTSDTPLLPVCELVLEDDVAAESLTGTSSCPLTASALTVKLSKPVAIGGVELGPSSVGENTLAAGVVGSGVNRPTPSPEALEELGQSYTI